MHSSFSALFLLALLAAFVAAAPTPQLQKRGSFKVQRVKNENYGGPDGVRALVKALNKFGQPIPDHVAIAYESKKQAKKAKAAPATNNNAANSSAQTGDVTATPESGDVEFLAPISIGGQTMNMDFDSGSSDLWVFNTQLPADVQAGHTNYDPTNSSTFSMIQGAQFSISYGDGSGAAGNVGTDTVNIGGATVTKQAIEMATAVSGEFVADTNSNGLVGLAFSKLNTVQPQQQKTFFDNVSGDLAEPVLTANLKHATAGAYEFGTIDNTAFTGTMQWTAINTTQGFWQFASESFAVGNGTTQKQAGIQAIADTGTTLMLGTQAMAEAYYGQIDGAANNATVGGFTLPCNANAPDLKVAIGNVMATVPGNLMAFEQIDDTNCFGGLQATSGDLGIYGDIFFKGNFVAFNNGNNSLGFAPHASTAST